VNSTPANHVYPLLSLEDLPHHLQPYTHQFEQACHFINKQLPSANIEGLPLTKLAKNMAHAMMHYSHESQSTLAALLYPFYCYQTTKSEIYTSIRAIGQLLHGAKAMGSIDTVYLQQTSDLKQLENLRRMTVAMANDIRIVVIKLIEQMQLLKHFLTDKQLTHQKAVQKITDIYIPLANRLGMGQIKQQLEDDTLQYLHPKAYQHIYQTLKRIGDPDTLLLKQITQTLQDKLQSIPQLTITSRFKHIYSIYQKMKKKNVPIEEIYDHMALRIIVPTVADCYNALGLIQNTWQSIPEEFDDYIAKPKPNHYQSIHTAITDGTHIFEIQIRTQAMHQQAEFGLASHRVYKEMQSDRALYVTKQHCLTDLLHWQFGLSNLPTDTHFNRVYVFTPQNQIIDLPHGATSIDLAYYIHSDIGNHCCGAKCRNQIVPLTYQLKTGDQIEILTHPKAKPSRDWLSQPNYLITSKAKHKVRQWFKQQDYMDFVSAGKNILKKALKRNHLKAFSLDDLVLKLNYKNSQDLLAAIGNNQLNPVSFLTTQPTTETESKTTLQKTQQTTIQLVEVTGIGKTSAHLAQCCKPTPTSTIIGYITKNRGVYIHRTDCPNILRKTKEQKKRLIHASWPTSDHSINDR